MTQSPAGQWTGAHLLEISRTVAPGAHAIIVLDGAGWHGSNALELPDNISLLSLPPYAPELNPVENIWAYLRANKLAISVFETYDQIVDACCEAWNLLAKYPSTIRSIATRDYAKPVNIRAVGIIPLAFLIMDQLIEIFECLTTMGCSPVEGFKCFGRSTSVLASGVSQHDAYQRSKPLGDRRRQARCSAPSSICTQSGRVW